MLHLLQLAGILTTHRRQTINLLEWRILKALETS